MVLRNDAESYSNRVSAGWLIADSQEAALLDLLECLAFKGQIAEAAAIALYKRTKRLRGEENLSLLGMDSHRWSQYLKSNKML